MASLRDVLDHAGKRVRVVSPGRARDGLAIRREDVVLLEPKLEPRAGDMVEFVETGERCLLEAVEPQESLGKVDHYRARVSAAVRG